MIGKQILHYKILQELGRGGMGVIYKAEDAKLKRLVAIKFLPRQIAASDDERERFKIEAQAAAALNHPNIATIYAIEEVDEEMFIVMEYIEGQELKNLAKVSNLRKVMDIATQIAAGLQAAHAKGVTHRDIKSGNIMVTESGQVKIMDFGLAKIAGGAQLTKDHSTLGTAAYMSPEQARGEPVDHRTDIWSFGVVLYEMLTGQLPFRGDYEQAVIYSILNEEPEPLTGVRTDLPVELERIVNKSLTKSPDERYQHLDELIVDLRSLKKQAHTQKAQRPETKTKTALSVRPFLLYAGLALLVIIALAGLYFWQKSNEAAVQDIEDESSKLQRLAVLPFSNLRSDPQTDFLGLALADQIIGSLTYLKNILVRPSSTVRKYQNQPIDAPTAGDELNVDYVLTGNYLKEGEVVRLNIELVDAHANTILWREQVEAKYENAFRLQDKVAEKVIAGLEVQFSPEERARMQADMPDDPLAYEYYLRSLAYPFSVEGSRLAIEMLKKSIQLDSTYAPAFSALGFRTNFIAQYELGSTGKVHEAKAAYMKALSLNDELPSALSNLATLHTETGQTGEAVTLLRRLLNINPNYVEGHFALSYVYRYGGMLEESRTESEKALSLDPRNRRIRSVAISYIYLGEFEEALEKLDIDPGTPWTLSWKANICLRLDRAEEAIDYLDRTIELEPQGILGFWALGLKRSVQGDRQEGITALRRWERTEIVDGEMLYHLASAYGLLGDKAACIQALRKAVEAGFFNYPFILRDSFLDSVRDEPEFQQVLAQAKAKHEAFKGEYF